VAREVIDAHERPVDPDLLRGNRKLDRLTQGVACAVRHPAAGCHAPNERKPIFFA
jgi:hypothetical protein